MMADMTADSHPEAEPATSAAADNLPAGSSRAVLTVVGFSGSVSGPDSACSCYLVERDGYRLVLDLGTGSLGPLQRHTAIADIDSVFASHAHGDHCRDLMDLVYLRARTGLSGPVTVYGPPNLPDAVASGWPGVEEYYTFEPAPKRIGPWDVRTAVVEHVVENWAIRLDDQLCYTGDTAPCAALDDLAAGCAVLLAEAACFDADRQTFHLSAGDAGRLAAKSGAKLLILTHLRPWHDARALLEEASREACCPVLLASSGLRVSLSSGRAAARS
jgi:ribonuclease BN (tRNA processing enzyme)